MRQLYVAIVKRDINKKKTIRTSTKREAMNWYKKLSKGIKSDNYCNIPNLIQRKGRRIKTYSKYRNEIILP